MAGKSLAVTAVAGACLFVAASQVTDKQKQDACCMLHDNCQYLQEGDSVPRECKQGYKFKADGIDLTIKDAAYPSTDDNIYNLSAANTYFGCECFDHGEWLCHDPLDFRKTLTGCPGGPTGEKKRAACCVMHDKCQYLQGNMHIPEECKVGHSFTVWGDKFTITKEQLPHVDANSFTLSSGGHTFDCDCFDHGDWYCSDPTFPQTTLNCKKEPSSNGEQTSNIKIEPIVV